MARENTCVAISWNASPLSPGLALDKLGDGRLPSWAKASRRLVGVSKMKDGWRRMDWTYGTDCTLTLIWVDKLRMAYVNGKWDLILLRRSHQTHSLSTPADSWTRTLLTGQRRCAKGIQFRMDESKSGRLDHKRSMVLRLLSVGILEFFIS